MKYDYEKSPQGFSQSGAEFNINYVYLKRLIPDLLTKKAKNKKLDVLEVGAGGGRNLLYLAHEFKGKLETFGTDISKTATEFAKKQGVEHAVTADSADIPYKQKFDLILLIDLLEHLESAKQVESTITNCTDHLSPGGVLYISSPLELNRFTLTWLFSKFPYFRDLTRMYFGHTVQFRNMDLIKLANKHENDVKVFYSAHIFTQLQMLLFFYSPKVLMEMLLGSKASNSLRDSNQYSSNHQEPKVPVLLVLKKILHLISRPLAALGFWESQIMESNNSFAENMHLVIRK